MYQYVKSKKQDASVPAIFIHRVTLKPLLRLKIDFNLLGFPIYVYETTVDAAVLAYNRGLISKKGVQRVIDAVINDPRWKNCSHKGCADYVTAIASARKQLQLK